MSRKSLITAAIVIVVGGFTLACCGDLFGGKEEEGPGISLPDIEVPGGPAIKSGSLSGTGDSDSFEINTNKDYLEVTFTWPTNSSFWVKVHGQDGSLLGDFDLANGEIIQLYGGGKFTLTIYSKSGSGPWTATYTP